jgi:hypothetical protein
MATALLMTTTVAIADWIKRIADDERRRDSQRIKEDEVTARNEALVRLNGRRLVDELRAAVMQDADAFRGEFPDDRARNVVVDAEMPDGGFVVRKPAPGAVTLTVTPSPEGASMACQYQFIRAGGLPPVEDRIDVMFAGDGGEAVRMKHHKTGQVFATAAALSELLLVPVFTGRPR